MTFNDQSAINAHYDTAHSQTTRRAKRGEGTHKCELCGKMLADKPKLKRHLSVVHGIGDVKTYQCNACSSVFTRSDNLQRHMKAKHAWVTSVVQPDHWSRETWPEDVRVWRLRSETRGNSIYVHDDIWQQFMCSVTLRVSVCHLFIFVWNVS